MNLSSRLHLLTEDVAATSCRINADIALEDDARHLATLIEAFEAALSGLEHGDNRLGIPTPEARAGLIARISEVRETLQPIKASAERLLDGTAVEADKAVLSKNHRDLMSKVEILAADVLGAYSNPVALLQSDAVTLNFLGRQRALATELARTACGVYSNNSDIGSQDELREAMQIYELTYTALANGMADAGISPPPSAAVQGALEDSIAFWDSKKANLTTDAMTADIVQKMAEYAADSVRETNNTITLYMVASPGQSDVFDAALESYTQDQLLAWLESPLLLESLLVQNDAHADLTEVEVVALDDKWRAEAKGEDGELIAGTLANPLSTWLVDQANQTGGIVTEVFVMDNKGLNVGQNAQTSDFWQGDEAKWIETFGRDSDDLHISELEYDESTRSYQTQASKIIRDPSTGEAIGAVTFGVNVMNLM
ncbi:MAG: hypothetical protein AAGA87_08780 [Pseudomonadota bacterium]